MSVVAAMADTASVAAISVLARAVLLMAFTLFAGIVQGRTTGRYPDVREWAIALRVLLSWDVRSERHSEGRDL